MLKLLDIGSGEQITIVTMRIWVCQPDVFSGVEFGGVAAAAAGLAHHKFLREFLKFQILIHCVSNKIATQELILMCVIILFANY